jgi:transmembrane sensor
MQLQRMEEATLWLQRMRNAAQDERVIEAWLDWCQRDPLNQQAFDDIAAVWELGGKLGAEPIGAAPRTRVPRRELLAASLAGVGMAIIAGVWWVSRDALEQSQLSELSTPIGINSVEMLADGSQLELGGGTRVTVAMGSRERRIELHEGELFVTVHKDAARPFSVDAGRLEVIATGTAFDVLRTSGRTTVTVAEGSVDALYEGQAAATPNVRLKPSQRLVYTHASHSVEVQPADPRAATAWRTGTLRFQNEPLSEVIATINRYAAKNIVIEDPRVAALAFTGTARTDHIASWLTALPHVFDIAIVELADGRQLIRPRPGAFAD